MAQAADEQTIKPGYKTTEFWLTTVASLLGLAYASGVVGSGTQLDHILGVGVIILTTMGYTVNRTIIKK